MIKELEDYDWFPALFRRFQLDFIGSIVQWTNLYKPLQPVLQQLVNQHRPAAIQDLCSGSGLPPQALVKELEQPPVLLLSDKFPDVSFKNTQHITYINESTDVLSNTPNPAYCYTLFNGFHHFTAAQQQALVTKMKTAGSPFLFAEVLEPTPLTFVNVVFSSTIVQVLVAPFIKPFSLLRLFFTWILPVNIITVLYDGIISVFKSKTARQYRRLFEGIGDEDYMVSVERTGGIKAAITYIKGTPVKK
jgi:hypothetical protein